MLYICQLYLRVGGKNPCFLEKTPGVDRNPPGVASLRLGVDTSPRGVASLPRGVGTLPRGVTSRTLGVGASSPGVAAKTLGVDSSPRGVAGRTRGVDTLPRRVASLPRGVDGRIPGLCRARRILFGAVPPLFRRHRGADAPLRGLRGANPVARGGHRQQKTLTLCGVRHQHIFVEIKISKLALRLRLSCLLHDGIISSPLFGLEGHSAHTNDACQPNKSNARDLLRLLD